MLLLEELHEDVFFFCFVEFTPRNLCDEEDSSLELKS